MAFMGYETPVEMPSMGVYNTDLMKMYIAGVKEQYDLAREEMKDFTKLYLLFNSDLPGQALLYNDLTVGGALKLIGDLYSRGIDPYKSPEARAVIALYINSAPIGKLKEMERSAENAKQYNQMAAKMKAAGTWGSDDFLRLMLGGQLLEEWDPNKPFTATAPYEYKDLDALTAQQFSQFKAQEDLGPSRDGYRLLGTLPARLELAIQSAINELQKTPLGLYLILLARRQAQAKADAEGRILSPELLQAETAKELYKNVKISAAKFFLPTEVEDKYHNDIKKTWQSAYAQNWLDKQKEDRDFESWKKKQEYNPKSPLYKFKDKPVVSDGTGKSYASWWDMFNDEQYSKTKGSSNTFLNGQVKKVQNAFKDLSGNYEITDKNIRRAINAMSLNVPSYAISTLLDRNKNKDGSINISRADISKIYHIDHIASRMYGSPMGWKNSDGDVVYVDKTKSARKLLKESIGSLNADMSGSDRIKGATMAVLDKFVYYINKEGKVRVFVPISVTTDKNTSRWNNKGYADDLMYDTGISGIINKKGEFVADDEQFLTMFNNQMTLKYANKSDKLYPEGDVESNEYGYTPTFDWSTGLFVMPYE